MFPCCRKRARQSKEERERAEEAARKEELKRLKNVKKKELQEKLARIKEMAGSMDSGKLKQLVDLDDDFDPDAYDRQMADMFGEEYYEGGDEDEELLGGGCFGYNWWSKCLG
jgi:protein KRI1